jgi:hypothetical protein
VITFASVGAPCLSEGVPLWAWRGKEEERGLGGRNRETRTMVRRIAGPPPTQERALDSPQRSVIERSGRPLPAWAGGGGFPRTSCAGPRRVACALPLVPTAPNPFSLSDTARADLRQPTGSRRSLDCHHSAASANDALLWRRAARCGDAAVVVGGGVVRRSPARSSHEPRPCVLRSSAPLTHPRPQQRCSLSDYRLPSFSP